jgi:hypothetical protein
VNADPLNVLLGELPPRIRAVIDTSVFPRLGDAHGRIVECVAALTGAHVIAYNLRKRERGLPLCTVVGQAYLGREPIARLRAAERRLPPGIVLVAYARPAEMRLPEETLIRAAPRTRST